MPPRLTAVVDTQGRRVTFDGATYTDVAGGRTVTSTRGADGTLASVRDAADKITQYGYTGGALTSITQPDGWVTRISYTADTPRRVASVTYGYGSPVAATTTFSYPDASTAQVIDANSHVTTYTVDSRGRVTRVRDALNRSRSTSYAANDLPATLTDDATSAVTRLTYDSKNNLTKIQAPDVAGGAAGSGRSVVLGYPAPAGSLADYQPTSGTDTQGNRTTYGYSATGNVSTVGTAAATGGTLGIVNNLTC